MGSLPDCVKRVAFKPNKLDSGGISVYRQESTSAELLVSRSDPREGGYFVARLRVADIVQLGLRVIPAKKDFPPKGHPPIPELRFGLKGADERKSMELQSELARLASLDVVLEPWSH